MPQYVGNHRFRSRQASPCLSLSATARDSPAPNTSSQSENPTPARDQRAEVSLTRPRRMVIQTSGSCGGKRSER